MLIRAAQLALLPAALLTLAACNTVEGAGQDIQAGGQAVENTAEEVEDEIDD
jgi:entericidin B